MRTREREYAASAASAVTATMVPAARYTELRRDENAYGFSESLRKFWSVQSGQLTSSPGWASNGAVTSHSIGSAQKATTAARKATRTRRPTMVRALIGAPGAGGRRRAR